MIKKIRIIAIPALGALIGWILAEPWHDDYGYFRDFMLFFSLALGIVLFVLCEQGVFKLKAKLFIPYLTNYRTYLIPFIGAVFIKLLFTSFVKQEMKCSQDEVVDRIVIVLDNSGSMSGYPLKQLKKSIGEYLQLLSCSDSQDEIAVVVFNSNAYVLTDPTTDYKAIEKAVNNLQIMGGTDMAAGLQQAYQVASQFENQNVTFLLVSDGYSNQNQVLKIIENTFININTIGVGDGYDEALLKTISTNSNGKFYPANDISSLTDIFAQIAQNQGGGMTQVSKYQVSEIQLSPVKRILGWTLLGLFIGITIGWVDKRQGIRYVVLLGSVIGGLLSSLLFITLDSLEFSIGWILRMITFGLFGLLIGVSIYGVSIVFAKLNTKSPF